MSGTYAQVAAAGDKRARSRSPLLTHLRSNGAHAAAHATRDEEEVTVSESPEPVEEFPGLPPVASSLSSFLLPVTDTDRGPFLSGASPVAEVKPVLPLCALSGGFTSRSVSPPSCRFERRSPNLRPSKVRRVETRGSTRGVPPPLSLSSFFAESLSAVAPRRPPIRRMIPEDPNESEEDDGDVPDSTLSARMSSPARRASPVSSPTTQSASASPARCASVESTLTDASDVSRFVDRRVRQQEANEMVDFQMGVPAYGGRPHVVRRENRAPFVSSVRGRGYARTVRVVDSRSRGGLPEMDTAVTSASSSGIASSPVPTTSSDSGVNVDIPATSSGVAPVFASDSDTRSESEDVVEQFLDSRRQDPNASQANPAPSPSPASSPGPVPSPAPSPSTGDSAPLWPMSVPEYIDFCDSVPHGVTDFSRGQTEVDLFVRGQRTPGSAGFPGEINVSAESEIVPRASAGNLGNLVLDIDSYYMVIPAKKIDPAHLGTTDSEGNQVPRFVDGPARLPIKNANWNIYTRPNYDFNIKYKTNVRYPICRNNVVSTMDLSEIPNICLAKVGDSNVSYLDF
ncbi:hypothetical protein PS15m_012299 [Mucor circinelloides]